MLDSNMGPSHYIVVYGLLPCMNLDILLRLKMTKHTNLPYAQSGHWSKKILQPMLIYFFWQETAKISSRMLFPLSPSQQHNLPTFFFEHIWHLLFPSPAWNSSVRSYLVPLGALGGDATISWDFSTGGGGGCSLKLKDRLRTCKKNHFDLFGFYSALNDHGWMS